MATEKIKDAASSFLGWLLQSDSIKVSNDQITDLAQYIQELGYGLEECGFVPVGSVKKDDSGKVEKIECDLEESNLYAYILENERTYTVDLIGKSVFGEAKRWGSRLTILLPFPYNTISAAQIVRDITQLYQSSKAVTQGMLKFDDIDRDDPDTKIEIDRKNGKLVIRQGVFQVDNVNYDLNGWTGRYGKPIELSLALHLSTMAPDFVRNFCLNDDLQTEVHVSTIKRNYDIKYYFETADGTILDKDTVDAAYDKLKKAVEIDATANGTDWSAKRDTDVSLFNENGDIEAPYVPIQMLDDLTTMSFMYSETDNTSSGTYYSEWIAIVDSNNNPVSFYDSNGKAKKFNFDVDGVKVDSNGKFNKTPKIINGESDSFDVFFSNEVEYKRSTTIDEIIDESGDVSFGKKGEDVDGLYIEGIGLSMNGIIARINNGYSINSGEEEELGWLFRQIDKLVQDINEYTNNGNGKSNEELKAIVAKFIAHNGKSYGKWYSSSDGYYYSKFEDILKSKDNAADKVSNLKKLRDDCKADYENIQECIMLIANDSKEALDDCGGISFSTLKLLHNFFNGEVKDIDTYEPYITKVTHHWYKDVYFTNQDGSTDGFYDMNDDSSGGTVSKKEKYDPQGLAADDETLNKLNEEGTIYVEMKGKYIEQLRQPEFKKNEKWHYMVKNWMTNGYYFIYDGTIETAKEIESAKKYLEGLGYDPSNPLLISYDNSKILTSSDNEVTDTATVEEIEKKAKEYNDALANAPKGEGEEGFKVRLQKINFAKKSSLAAFSILEGVHTEDSEQVYADLKEFLIELGYFTEEDFELIETGVLDWLIPEYQPDEWPNKKYEKKDNEYGTYIRSKSSLDAERAEKGETDDEGTTSVSQSGNLGLSNSAGGVDQIEVDASQYGEEGYATVTCINGATYKDYKQGAYAYLGLQNSQYPRIVSIKII